MTDYLRLILLRGWRTRLWLAPILASLLLPLMATAPGYLHHRQGGLTIDASGIARADVEVVSTGAVALLGACWVVNVIAFVIYEEKSRGRSQILRVANVDGRIAVGSLLLLSAVTALVVCFTGFLGPAVVGLRYGWAVFPWVKGALAGVLYLTLLGPLAVAGGYLLPRSIALLVLNAIALVSAVVIAPVVRGHAWLGEPLLAPFVAAVAALSVAMPVLSILWRRTSVRLW